MSNFEAWAKLLLTYGPFALLLLFVFVIETRARSFMKETTDKRAGQAVLLLTWTAIFLLGVVIVAVWIKLNVPGSEVAIKGRLTGLETNHRLASPYDGLYLRRVYEGNSYTAFAWRIITSEAIKDGSVVPLVLDRTVADDAGVHDETVQFELPVSADFYRREVELTYSRRDQLILLKTPTGPVSLPGQAVSAISLPLDPPTWAERLGVTERVAAQPKWDPNAMSQRLEADDPVIRLRARSELADAGVSGLPYIDGVLANPSSSYRLQLGVLVAINKMALKGDPLSGAANCAVAGLRTNKDPAIATQAYAFVKSHPGMKLGGRCSGPALSDPACEKSQNVKLDGRRAWRTPGSDVFMYLAGIASNDSANVYVVRDSSGMLDKVMGSADLKQAVSSLKFYRDAPLADRTYRLLLLQTKLPADVPFTSDSALRMRITLEEANPLNSYVVVRVCSSP